jgi:hypothetical protein
MYLGCVSLSASSLKKLKKTRTNTNNNNNKNKADAFHFLPSVLLVGEKYKKNLEVI